MPNWCLVTTCITGWGTEVEQLRNCIEKIEKEPSRVDNDFGSLFLGNIVEALGGDYTKVYCRGYVTDMYEDNLGLHIDMETAWAPMYEFHEFLKEKFPSLTILYMAEEPGCGVYETNDAEGYCFNPSAYEVVWDNNAGDYGHEEADTFQEVLDIFNHAWGQDAKTEDDIAKFLIKGEEFYYKQLKVVKL